MVVNNGRTTAVNSDIFNLERRHKFVISSSESIHFSEMKEHRKRIIIVNGNMINENMTNQI